MEYKLLEIILKRCELLCTMEEVAFITADAMVNVDEKMRSTIQDLTQEGRIGRVTTCMNKAWGELLHALTAYTKEGLKEDNVGNNHYREPENYSVVLKMPISFSENSIPIVTDTMHAYIVNRTLAQWFAVVKKDEAVIYSSMAEDDLVKLKRYLNTRVTTQRVRMSVF